MHTLDLNDRLEKAGLRLSNITNVYCENTLVYVYKDNDSRNWEIIFKGSVSNAVLYVKGKKVGSTTPEE